MADENDENLDDIPSETDYDDDTLDDEEAILDSGLDAGDTGNNLRIAINKHGVKRMYDALVQDSDFASLKYGTFRKHVVRLSGKSSKYVMKFKLPPNPLLLQKVLSLLGETYESFFSGNYKLTTMQDELCRIQKEINTMNQNVDDFMKHERKSKIRQIMRKTKLLEMYNNFLLNVSNLFAGNSMPITQMPELVKIYYGISSSSKDADRIKNIVFSNYSENIFREFGRYFLNDGIINNIYQKILKQSTGINNVYTNYFLLVLFYINVKIMTNIISYDKTENNKLFKETLQNLVEKISGLLTRLNNNFIKITLLTDEVRHCFKDFHTTYSIPFFNKIVTTSVKTNQFKAQSEVQNDFAELQIKQSKFFQGEINHKQWQKYYHAFCNKHNNIFQSTQTINLDMSFPVYEQETDSLFKFSTRIESIQNTLIRQAEG